MKIAVIGYGYVGHAVERFFKLNHKNSVIHYDTNPMCSSSATQEEVNQCDLAVICVSTPCIADGSCDISAVESTVNWLNTPLILIKSTVPPKTTDNLRKSTKKHIVFSPEYIGESTYYTGKTGFDHEILDAPFYIFGGEPEDTAKLVEIYQRIAGPFKIYHQTSDVVAELTKYMENSYLATKVAFCHEFHQICKVADADYQKVRECWLLDPRIGASHTAVFSDSINPFGGKCLPKDISAIVKFSQQSGYTPKLLEEVISSNDRIGKIRKSNNLMNNKSDA